MNREIREDNVIMWKLRGDVLGKLLVLGHSLVTLFSSSVISEDFSEIIPLATDPTWEHERTPADYF